MYIRNTIEFYRTNLLNTKILKNVGMFASTHQVLLCFAVQITFTKSFVERNTIEQLLPMQFRVD